MVIGVALFLLIPYFKTCLLYDFDFIWLGVPGICIPGRCHRPSIAASNGAVHGLLKALHEVNITYLVRE